MERHTDSAALLVLADLLADASALCPALPARHSVAPLCSNVHVMREQLERAEARARQAEELLPDATDLQGRLAAAEQQLGRWRLILEGTADCASPEDVLHLLNSLQKQLMEAAVQVGWVPMTMLLPAIRTARACMCLGRGMQRLPPLASAGFKAARALYTSTTSSVLKEPPAQPRSPVVVQVGDKAEEVAQLRSAAAAADAARAEAEQAAAAAHAASEQVAAALSRAERKLVLLTKERDGLKSILASYDEEYLNQQGGRMPATGTALLEQVLADGGLKLAGQPGPALRHHIRSPVC